MDRDLRLRPADPALDALAALPWYQDPEVLLFSEGRGAAPYDLAKVQVMYSQLAAQGELYIVQTLTPEGWFPIGDATLTPEDLPIVIGDPAWRGRGLGRRVVGMLLQRARELGWSSARVKCVYTYNLRARRLFEGAGFRLVEEARSAGGEPCWRFELALEPLPGAWSHQAFLRQHSIPGLERMEQYAAVEVDWLVQVLGARPGQTLLDLGCGLGRHSRELARRGYRAVGVDASPVLVREARRRATGVGPGEVIFGELDMRKLDSHEEYDHAFCIYESGFGRLGDDLAHLDFLRRVREALRPGGRFALGVRNVYRWAARGHPGFDPVHARMLWAPGELTDETAKPYVLRDTVRGFTPPEIALMAGLAGLTVHSRYGVERIGQIRPGIRLDDIEFITVVERRA